MRSITPSSIVFTSPLQVFVLTSLLVLGLGWAFAGHAQDGPARHAAVSAASAQQAIARGASVLDVRSQAAFEVASLPNAVLVENAAGMADQALAQALTAAGIDLSREVLLLGDPGSEQAQALHQRLAQVSSGRVLWLVGGLAEWSAVGAATVPGRMHAKRWAVPQRLVVLPGVNVGNSAQGRSALPAHTAHQPELARLYGYARLY